MAQDPKTIKDFVIVSLQGIHELMKAGKYMHAQHFLKDFIAKANKVLEPTDYVVEELDKDITIG